VIEVTYPEKTLHLEQLALVFQVSLEVAFLVALPSAEREIARESEIRSVSQHLDCQYFVEKTLKVVQRPWRAFSAAEALLGAYPGSEKSLSSHCSEQCQVEVLVVVIDPFFGQESHWAAAVMVEEAPVYLLRTRNLPQTFEIVATEHRRRAVVEQDWG
jgi:hypothetical protein